MKLIVGLGNPGKEYEKTRHNIGFMVVDNFQKEYGFEDFKEEKAWNALITRGELDGAKVILVKPLTFMNKSGEAIQKIAQFYKITPENIMVVYDDLDTDFGSIRMRKNGGPGTHNGMKSVVSALGENFPRLRVGIESRGATSPSEQETTSFVLSPFTAGETKQAKEAIKKAVSALKTALEKGIEAAMNRYNN